MIKTLTQEILSTKLNKHRLAEKVTQLQIELDRQPTRTYYEYVKLDDIQRIRLFLKDVKRPNPDNILLNTVSVLTGVLYFCAKYQDNSSALQALTFTARHHSQQWVRAYALTYLREGGYDE